MTGSAMVRSIPDMDQDYGADVSLGVRVVDLHRVHEIDGTFTPEHIALIKRAYASENLTDEEFQIFLYVAQRRGLDPLAKQIYAIKRSGKMAIQVGIDGLRLQAVRSRAYAGSDDPVYLPEDESTPYPRKATVTVYRKVDGQRIPFTASARWSEYAPADLSDKSAFMWRTKGYLLLGKCAEALALRKAFPSELAECHWQPQVDTTPTVLNPSGPERNVAHDVRIVEVGAGRWIAEGNTMPSKERIKAFGFRWNSGDKVWETGDEQIAAKAREFFSPPTGGFDSRPRALEPEG